MLVAPNASVLTLLPLLLEHLVKRDDEAQLVIDEDKAVMLALTMGAAYLEAITMATQGQVVFEVVGQLLAEQKHATVARYLTGVYDRTPTFVTVAHTQEVDLKCWYCSCSEYQRQYAGVSPLHPEGTSAVQPLSATADIVGDTQNLVVRILLGSHLQSRHKSPLPICSHLLALMICAYNADEMLYRLQDGQI